MKKVKKKRKSKDDIELNNKTWQEKESNKMK